MKPWVSFDTATVGIVTYIQTSEDMQNEAVTELNLVKRQQIYFDWQNMFMDKIVPMLPFYSYLKYQASWSNLVGYNSSWGIVDCLPYMHFVSLHENQSSISEFNLADAAWRDLNPLQTDDTSSSFIYSLISEPIVGWSQEMKPVKNALVKEWLPIDEYHYRFTLRDNIFWNPSYNISFRNEASPPLDPLTTPLLTGLKEGFVSDGTNLKVTAKDAVFTLLAAGNDLVSNDIYKYDWIADCYVDPIDEYSFHILVDGDSTTLELEKYVDFWYKLSTNILPEFFLNSTDSTVSYTSGGVECIGLYEGIQNTTEWKSFSYSPFSCGKYMLDFHINDSITVLRASPYWFGKGIIDGTSQVLDLDTINIHIIPDISEELSLFKDGYLDLTSLTAFPEERKLMQKDSRFNVQSTLSSSFTFLAFNIQKSFIGGSNNDKFLTLEGKTEYTKGAAIRKALCYSIDRVEMNNQFSDGEYFIADSPMYPIIKYYYNEDIIKYTYNLSLAEEWLSAALDPIQTSAQYPPILQFSVALVLIFYIIKRKKRVLAQNQPKS